MVTVIEINNCTFMSVILLPYVLMALAVGSCPQSWLTMMGNEPAEGLYLCRDSKDKAHVNSFNRIASL